MKEVVGAEADPEACARRAVDEGVEYDRARCDPHAERRENERVDDDVDRAEDGEEEERD